MKDWSSITQKWKLSSNSQPTSSSSGVRSHKITNIFLSSETTGVLESWITPRRRKELSLKNFQQRSSMPLHHLMETTSQLVNRCAEAQWRFLRVTGRCLRPLNKEVSEWTSHLKETRSSPCQVMGVMKFQLLTLKMMPSLEKFKSILTQMKLEMFGARRLTREFLSEI